MVASVGVVGHGRLVHTARCLRSHLPHSGKRLESRHILIQFLQSFSLRFIASAVPMRQSSDLIAWRSCSSASGDPSSSPFTGVVRFGTNAISDAIVFEEPVVAFCVVSSERIRPILGVSGMVVVVVLVVVLYCLQRFLHDKLCGVIHEVGIRFQVLSNLVPVVTVRPRGASQTVLLIGSFYQERINRRMSFRNPIPPTGSRLRQGVRVRSSRAPREDRSGRHYRRSAPRVLAGRRARLS